MVVRSGTQSIESGGDREISEGDSRVRVVRTWKRDHIPSCRYDGRLSRWMNVLMLLLDLIPSKNAR